MAAFDLRYGGDGPAELLEYNADTPTSVLETGVFQWMWLEQGIERKALPKDADQFNSVHERLIQGWKEIGKSRHPAEDQLAAIRIQCSGNGLIPCCIILGNPIREIEGGKEIQEGKARSPGAQEEGDEEGEAGQESKG
jgi:Glutathionylspermidine synthase preATP-grasp